MTHLGPSLRRTKVRDRPGRRAALAAVASLAVNALGILLLARAGAFQMGAPKEASRVALAPVSADRWAANRAIRDGKERVAAPFPMPRPQQQPKPEPEPDRKPKGQVVDVAPSKDSTPPKSSRFLSDRDSSVEKETRSKHARAGYDRTLEVPSAPGASAPPPPGEGGQSDRSAPGVEGKPSELARKTSPRVARAPEAEGDLAGAAPSHDDLAPAPAKPGEGEGGERSAGVPGSRRLIAPGTLARIAGGPAPDRLEGVEEAEGTYLNTRSWKYATYFNRIKQAVAARWDPLAPLDARDPDRTMFGHRDRFTLLGVTLDDGGRVKSLVVEETSGIEFLDRAAVAAFEGAQPFVNPPRGVVDGKGEIKFSFGFFIEMGRGGLRLYRAPMSAMP
jgi:TonB family protein